MTIQKELIRTYIKLLLEAPAVSGEKIKAAALNPLIGHITETAAGLVALGISPPNDLESYKDAVLNSIRVKNRSRAASYLDAAWKGLESAGQLEMHMERGIAMGDHLKQYLVDNGVQQAAVEWTGPGGGTETGVGTADIVVSGVVGRGKNKSSFKKGFSAKASKSAAKTLGGLSLGKLFPTLVNDITSNINTYAKKKAAELAAEAGGDPNYMDATWPAGNNGYAGAWILSNPGKKYNPSTHRTAGEQVWKNSVTNELSIGIANEVLGLVEPYLLEAATAIYNHLKEGEDVLKLLPSGIEENNPIAEELSKAISGKEDLSANVAGTGVIISVGGMPLIKLRPRVKDPGRSMSVNTTVEPASRPTLD